VTITSIAGQTNLVALNGHRGRRHGHRTGRRRPHPARRRPDQPGERVPALSRPPVSPATSPANGICCAWSSRTGLP